MSQATIASPGNFLGLDEFAFRQFDDPKFSGSKIVFDKTEFIKKVNEIWKTANPPLQLKDGYAPFCKHLFVENFVGAEPGALEITSEVLPLIECGYSARREGELPVLSRWVPKSKVKHLIKPSKCLDLILYSREQITKERAAMRRDLSEEERKKAETEIDESEPPWSVISIKAQDETFELPMAPITMMRNTLIEEGGSGVGLDRQKYMASVAYWKDHVNISTDE
uniref:Uncharacterized protein n=1 Tax=Chromera velia CCMP2878 TaxID=1169474 RepID=A0A0G4HFB2_9ALVE|eukprot:Cvel_6639.t1-p1 / transcript=Cvel_6639.t1 / gene=Cvel_6639 / organism=Chromera_velia_CCMP2878 / gene_product=hypothetical protein / transcript_product=hypothetical protein / location=Cvel_scaffold329:35707-41174(+) / protein_length=223 / sequence_SO=supercontig / SO=protein_coding / is_pseudo=false